MCVSREIVMVVIVGCCLETIHIHFFPSLPFPFPTFWFDKLCILSHYYFLPNSLIGPPLCSFFFSLFSCLLFIIASLFLLVYLLCFAFFLFSSHLYALFALLRIPHFHLLRCCLIWFDLIWLVWLIWLIRWFVVWIAVLIVDWQRISFIPICNL